MYRYGFNGKENDRETVGTGEGLQDYGMRIYNPSLGRFLSIDPITKQYPELTPYQFASNTPIWAIDLDGLEAVVRSVTQWYDSEGNLQETWTESAGVLGGTGTQTWYTAPDGTTTEHWSYDIVVTPELTFIDIIEMPFAIASNAMSKSADAVEAKMIAADGWLNSTGDYWGDHSSDWIQSTNIGVEFEIPADLRGSSFIFRFGLYSTSEDNIGAYFEGVDQFSIASSEPASVGVNGFFFANTNNSYGTQCGTTTSTDFVACSSGSLPLTGTPLSLAAEGETSLTSGDASGSFGFKMGSGQAPSASGGVCLQTTTTVISGTTDLLGQH